MGAPYGKFMASDEFLINPMGDKLFASAPLGKHDDSVSQAKPGQKVTMVKAMTKNMYFTIIKYLKHNEIFSLALTSKSIYQRVSSDEYFEKLAAKSYLLFFNSQF